MQVLFGGTNTDLLDHFYGDGLLSSHWMTAITAAVQKAASKLPEGRGLRILEVGAGTAGLAAQLLPLLERGVHSYTFTDVSAGFFPAPTSSRLVSRKVWSSTRAAGRWSESLGATTRTRRSI